MPVTMHSDEPVKPRSSDQRAMREAVQILEANRIMAISTVRPDGWPQTTIVGYANRGLDVYFMIFRSSQKFSNIQHDNRVSIAVGKEPAELLQAKAVFAGAYAVEIKKAADRKVAWECLKQRHPNLDEFDVPDGSDAVMMQAACKHISLADYTKGVGHTVAFTAED